MAEMWEKKHKVTESSGGWGRNLKSFERFRTLAMVSKEELIAYLNKHNAKAKMKAKALKELAKRGVKLVWK
jgi:hypothetical protein